MISHSFTRLKQKFILTSLFCTLVLAKDAYWEDLSLQTTKDGNIIATFNFTRIMTVSSSDHYTLFPKSIAYVTETFQANEWHLSFTQGRWFTERWGNPPTSAGTGVQLWARFSPHNVDEQWSGLTNTLSGLFCASLNFIGEVNTVKPVYTFHGTGKGVLRFASLPREASCTENLTPWTKLLPCHSKSGLASLMNPYKLYDANFHSMSIDMVVSCLDKDCKKKQWNLQQTMSVVMDPVRLTLQADWTIGSLFKIETLEKCAVAKQSTIHLNKELQNWKSTDKSNVFDVSNIGTRSRQAAPSIPVHIHRSLTGWGMESGGIVVVFTNTDSQDWLVAYLDSLPWFVKPYMHTLTFSHEIVMEQRLQPSQIRSRPTTMEFLLRIPSNSTVKMSYEFDKAHLRYTEHPPDANRGFDIAPGVMTLLHPLSPELKDYKIGPNTKYRHRRLYTESLLVSLPTPDFSMPYNVITLTCTVVALFFGNMFNLLIRKFLPVVVLMKKEQ